MINILFVDDDIDMLKQAEIILSRENDDFEIETAISGEEALDLLSKNDFDIIISDYKMPSMNGVELLKEIRNTEIESPFILLTAAGDEGVAMHALNYGADRYIIKEGRVKKQFEILAKEIQQEIKHSRTRRELIESERKYEDLVKNLPVGIYKTTLEGKIIHGNKALAQILGYSDVKKLRKIDAFDLFVKPGDRKKWIEMMKEKDIVENFEYKIQRQNGDIKWVEDTARAVKDEEGRIDHFNGIIRDITEIKEVEEELGQSKEWLSLTFNILDSFADPIVTTDNKGNIAFVNHSTEELFGIKRNEVVGDNFNNHFKLFSAKSEERIDDPIKEILEGNEAFLKDDLISMNTKNGREDVICDGYPILKESGNIIGTILNIKKVDDIPEVGNISLESKGISEYFDDLVTGIVILSSEDYTPVTFNNAALEYLEYSREEFKDISVFNWSIEKEGTFTFKNVKESLAESGSFSTRVIKKYENDGERILSLDMRKIKLDSEEKILLSIYDISKEVEEMKRINQKSNKYRMVFNSVDEGVVVARVDKSRDERPIDVTVLDVNSAFQDLMGVERGEILGKNWSEILFKLDEDHLEKIGSAVKYNGSESFKLMDNKTNRKIDVKVVSEKDDRVILIFKKPYS